MPYYIYIWSDVIVRLQTVGSHCVCYHWPVGITSEYMVYLLRHWNIYLHAISWLKENCAGIIYGSNNNIYPTKAYLFNIIELSRRRSECRLRWNKFLMALSWNGAKLYMKCAAFISCLCLLEPSQNSFNVYACMVIFYIVIFLQICRQ